MGFENLSVRLGERILKEQNVQYGQVLHVDFCVDWFNGTDATPGDTDYPVKVTFVRNEQDPCNANEIHTNQYTVAKVFDSMTDIMKELENIEEELRYD